VAVLDVILCTTWNSMEFHRNSTE